MNDKKKSYAIIGMMVRYPKCKDIDEFWNILINGKECITTLNDIQSHIESKKSKNYVNAASILENYDSFDYEFFGFSKNDALNMDPQHRIFLEVCWQALEHAGYDPLSMKGSVGLFGSAAYNNYLLYNLEKNPDIINQRGYHELMIGNDKDYMCTRVSYKLNLHGPSITVQTACSSSLMAVHLACQSLSTGDSDCCLAGGVSISIPSGKGYIYNPNLINSRDGHCRPFDHKSSGTVFGSGVGVVVLKRLEDAIRDKDTIYSIISSTAINNDGNEKVGITAPSLPRQTEVLNSCLKKGGLEPKTISFIEAHGTGTELGDLIELEAIKAAYGLQNLSEQNQYPCVIGSVKSNLGHMDAASGITGLIKATLAVYHKLIPPTVHFEKLNPRLNLNGTRFIITNQIQNWDKKQLKKRAGISSFGVGGTNVHAIIEEFEAPNLLSPKDFYLIKISAKNERVLTRLEADIMEKLCPKTLNHAAYTLNTGRHNFDFRTYLIVNSTQGNALSIKKPFLTEFKQSYPSQVVFICPGICGLYREVGLELYRKFPDFAFFIEECNYTINKLLHIDIVDIFYKQQRWELLKEESNLKLISFMFQYSMIQFLRLLNLSCVNMFGVNIGKFVVECLSGKLNLEEAVNLVYNQALQPLPLLNQELEELIKKTAVSNQKRTLAIILGFNLNLKEVEPILGQEFNIVQFLLKSNECFNELPAFLDLIGYCWQVKIAINWEVFHKGGDTYRIPVPVYPFEKNSLSLNPPLKNSVSIWKKSWYKMSCISKDGFISEQTYIIGQDTSSIKTIEYTLNNNKFSTIIGGTISEFSEKLTQKIFYKQIIKMSSLGIIIVLSSWNFQQAEKDYLSFIKLVRIFKQQFPYTLINITFISGNLNIVPENSIFLGIVSSLSIEIDNPSFKWIEMLSGNLESIPLFNALKSKEKYCAIQQGELLSLNFEKVPISNSFNGTSFIRENGNYLITGGLGNVGLLFAQTIAQHAKTNIFLISRSVKNKSEEVYKEIEFIKSSGSKVECIEIDVIDFDALEEIVHKIEQKYGKIHGVIHAAGKAGKAMDDLNSIDSSTMESYFSAKIKGTENLFDIFSTRNIDFCFFVSSTTAVLGGIGDTLYASANAYEKHFIDYVLNFKTIHGKWISVDYDYLPRMLEDSFVSKLGQFGKSLFEYALNHEEFNQSFSHLLCMDSGVYIVSKSDFNKRFSSFNEIKKVQNIQKVQAIDPLLSQTQKSVYHQVREIWASILGSEQIEKNRNFFDLGGDSFSGIKLINMINTKFSINLSYLDLYMAPTLNQFINKVQTQEEKKQDNIFDNNHHTQEEKIQDDDFAIIGMAGRFPGARDIDELWDNLINGRVSIQSFQPTKCWDGYENIGRCGMLQDIEMFDHRFFGISKKEADLTDPQHRLFLEYCWLAFEDAGYIPDQVKEKVGVFASTCVSGYLINDLLPHSQLNPVDFQTAIINNSPDSLATRVSYRLNLRGPSKTVQTFCSSSLVALNDAIMSIRSSECEYALVGGVNIVVPQEQGYCYDESLMYSKNGEVRPFDKSADGTVFSNGIGVILIKRFKAAVQDKDFIHGIIKSISINNDGSNKVSFYSPSISGQQECIETAYKQKNIDPSSVHYIEAHGTGTRIGDWIEIEALNKAFHQKSQIFNEKCFLGSMKGNVGHLDRAAGITSLIKAILIVKNKKIPPTVNFNEPNENIDFEKTVFKVNKKLEYWTGSGLMRAAVSALGVGGTNVHVIIDAYEDKNENSSNPTLILRPFKFSAESEESLGEYLKSIKKFLMENNNINFDDLSFTLAVGRKDFKFRYAFIAGNIDELLLKIDEFQLPTKVNTALNESTVPLDFPLKKVIQLWLQGGYVVWSDLFKDKQFRRLSLPVYKFERIKCWFNNIDDNFHERSSILNNFQIQNEKIESLFLKQIDLIKTKIE